MNCYFDTSIYNKILDDPQKDLIIEGINKRKMTTIPSAVNLCEILSTRDKKRKRSLLNVYHKIRNEYFALKPFTELLRDATLAIQENKDEIEVNYHIEIDKDTEDLCRQITSSAGKEFEKYILGARKFIEKISNKENTDEESSNKIKIPDATTFFKISYADNMYEFWIHLFIEAFKGLGIHELKLEGNKIISIINSNYTPWKYYLDSCLLIFYRRAFLSSGYGRKSNPGGSDLEQCIYLFWANIFVIQDGNFYDFLKELDGLRGYNKKIFTYDEFKKDLGL